MKNYKTYVTKKPNGRYYGRIVYEDANGKRHEKSAGGFKLKKDAIKHTQELLQEMLNSAPTTQNNISLYDYYIKWFKLYKAKKITAVTKNRYVVIGNVIKDYFKDTPLKDIKRSDYQELINQYGSTHAPDTVSKFNNTIRKCVSYAIDDDIITKAFTHNVQLVANKDKKVEVEYLTTEEIITLKRAVVAKLNHYNTSRYMILTAIYTGMRKAEIQGLTWKDIDFIHGTITVNKSWDDVRKKFKPTKNESSNRTIPVNTELLDWLKELQANGTTMVFQNVLGTIPTGSALNKCLRVILHGCGLHKKNFHFHSLRHCHVALLMSNKDIDIYAISKRLGHANVNTTLNTYAYLLDDYKSRNDQLILQKLSEI